MEIERVRSPHQTSLCIEYACHNPIRNLLFLADLYPPLSRVSDSFMALDGGEVVGLGVIFRGFKSPAVNVTGRDQRVECSLLEELAKHLPERFFTICESDQVRIFKEQLKIENFHLEQQMLLKEKPDITAQWEVERVRQEDLPALGAFYKTTTTQTWNPIQFEAGPYYCVKIEDRIVSAAGVHFLTPQIGQIGNVITEEKFRRKGMAKACTAAVAAEIISRGIPASLFVRTDNSGAINLYRGLGFMKVRELSFLELKKE
jgi:GNAT superfamily N-acetyltransferase